MTNQHQNLSIKPIILTGDRATGPLHLGHYVGSLRQRVDLQKTHDQTILVADMQGLTDHAFEPRKVSQNIFEVVADYLAVGIDPELTTICLQSQLPALAELTMYYSNVVTVSQLERNPTVKKEIEQKQFGRAIPAGFLTYPVSQSSDITAFRATIVPAGEDQLPVIEQTNDIVKKINALAGRQVLSPCRVLLSKTPRLIGIDGKNKMSKSLGNAISLGACSNTITAAVRAMYTDPLHIKASDPGRIEGNVVFAYLDAFHPDPIFVQSFKEHYQRGGLGDSMTKRVLEDCLQELMEPIRHRRSEFIRDKAMLLQVLKSGSEKARERTEGVLKDVRDVFGLNLF